MIASRIGLVLLVATACVLAAIVVIDMQREVERPSRLLVDGFDAPMVTRLAWSRTGQPDVVIERAGDAWRWVAPVKGIAADPSAVDAVLAALRGGRWHRRADAARAGVARATLTVTSTSTLIVRVGAPLQGAAQSWIAIGERAYLVDDWVARAIAPEPLALRETRPLRDATTAEAIVVERPGQGALRLEGRRMVKPKQVLLDARHAAEVARALAAMRIVGTPSAKRGDLEMAVSVVAPPLVTVEVYSHGCVDPQVAIGGTAGEGCIAAADYEAIVRALDATLRPPAQDLAEPRPITFEPQTIVLADGSVLDLKARPRIGDRDADVGAVAELVAALQAPMTVVDSAETQVTGALTVTDAAGGQHVIELLRGKQLRRKGEPVALVPGDGAWAIVTRAQASYVDPRLWIEEPSTIRSITVESIVGKATYTRGAVIGEWDGTDKDGSVETFARALAQLRASAHVVTAAPGLVKVAFEVVPPAGAATTRTLSMSMPRCAASVDGIGTVALDPKFCAELKPLLP